MSSSPDKKPSTSIAIIGGGAAGFFSAICAAEAARAAGRPVKITIFEASGRYLKKVKISGGGRCNVTHNQFDVRTFCQNYPRGSRELLSPMQRFQAKDTVEWFKRAGVRLVAEADGRMFPDTDSSETIIGCYLDHVKKYGIELVPNTPVQQIQCPKPNHFVLKSKGAEFEADSVLIATGSSNGGYVLAESLGHTISERAPSLFSFKIKDPLIDGLSGLSFTDVSLKLTLPKKSFKQQGPMLVTHWGLSGPAILKLSAWAAREMKRANYQGTLSVNWMCDKNADEIKQELVQIKSDHSKKAVKNYHPEKLASRFWESLLKKLSIDGDKKWADLSKKDISRISENLVASNLKIAGQNRYKDEFVECGGVSLKEINFKTMQSKIHPGLYFAGEILDVDGITGGFNFQNAWTTGWVAAQDMVNAR